MGDETASAGDTQDDPLGDAGRLLLELHGQQFDFRYTNSEYMRNVVLAILKGQEYPLLKSSSFTPTTIVDAGANVGATALFFHHAYPAADVFCYEPSEENFRCLRENTSRFANKIHIFHYGLLDRDCQLPLYRGTSQTGQNSLVSNTETTAAPTESVRLVKASREAAERGWNHISILKLDTEGCEVPILSELLASVPDIELIYCEYHAEDDRRTIDALVADRFCLYWATATKLHQGTCLYMARSLIAKFPDADIQQKSFRAG